MFKIFSLIFTTSILMNCNRNTSIGKETNEPKEVMIKQNFSDLAPMFYNNSDTTYVVNFWATSCPPCIREMPHFGDLSQRMKNEKLKVILVSLDYKKDLESRVKPFVVKHHILPQVVLLADDNYSAWTDDIDASWYGALPATMIVRGNEKAFSFGAFEAYEDLEKMVLPILKK